MTFAQPSGSTELADEVRGLISRGAARAPRSLQRAIGPSEVGQPCARKLAYQLLDMPKSNSDSDSWYSVIGTAVHAWMADALERDNERLGRKRWLVEQRVTIRTGLTGTCDAYDTDSRRVIDWKVVGNSSLDKYRSKGPRQEYVAQAHLYGVGWVNEGRPVERVALVFLPRSKNLDKLHTWESEFRPDVAARALERMDNVLIAAQRLDLENHPDRWAALPSNPSSCFFCPYRTNKVTSACDRGCPGEQKGN